MLGLHMYLQNEWMLSRRQNQITGWHLMCSNDFVCLPFGGTLLFAEPRVDKAQVGKLEENVRSYRSYRRIYRLWAIAQEVFSGGA